MRFSLLYGIECSFLVVLKPKVLAADTIIGIPLIICACMSRRLSVQIFNLPHRHSTPLLVRRGRCCCLVRWLRLEWVCSYMSGRRIERRNTFLADARPQRRVHMAYITTMSEGDYNAQWANVGIPDDFNGSDPPRRILCRRIISAFAKAT